jgi:hypothetical protein
MSKLAAAAVVFVVVFTTIVCGELFEKPGLPDLI